MKGIYKITNKKNDRKYIGLSKDIFFRLNQHFNDLQNNLHHNKKLQDDFNKYKYNQFIFEVVEICEDNIYEVEQKYIKELKETDYNIHGLKIKKVYNNSYKNNIKKEIVKIREISKTSVGMTLPKDLNVEVGIYKYISHKEGDKIIIELEKIFKEEKNA